MQVTWRTLHPYTTIHYNIFYSLIKLQLYLWHVRLGHPSFQVLKKIKPISSLFHSNVESKCTVCPSSKQHMLPFPNSTSQATSVFSLFIWMYGDHTNTQLFKSTSVFPNKCTYFHTIVDDCSRATWTYLLPSKHHCVQLFKYSILMSTHSFKQR